MSVFQEGDGHDFILAVYKPMGHVPMTTPISYIASKVATPFRGSWVPYSINIIYQCLPFLKSFSLPKIMKEKEKLVFQITNAQRDVQFLITSTFIQIIQMIDTKKREKSHTRG